MVEQQAEGFTSSDQVAEDQSAEEEGGLSGSRALVLTMLTPLAWGFGIPLLNLIVETFAFEEGIPPDSLFVHITWFIFILILPASGTFEGLGVLHEIRESGDRKGLWPARLAVIFGIGFGVLSLIMLAVVIVS